MQHLEKKPLFIDVELKKDDFVSGDVVAYPRFNGSHYRKTKQFFLSNFNIGKKHSMCNELWKTLAERKTIENSLLDDVKKKFIRKFKHVTIA